MKAIETRYNGYNFRSRLEARWAVFFDKSGIEYKYEPEGFVKCCHEDGEDCDDNCVRYLPDFYLPNMGVWVEVKGSDELMKNDSRRLEYFLDFGCPMPGFTNSYGSNKGGLVILGEVPETHWGIVFHPIVQHDKGLIWSWCCFHYHVFHVFSNDFLLSMLSHETRDEPSEWSTKSVFITTPYANKVTMDAYKTARSARFEHGECPTTNKVAAR